MDGDGRELEYYRAVEDFFAGLRGGPHVLSPKDFQLLREWWRNGIPLSAVLAGIAETFETKRARGDPDPVVSLSYCRHAVRRHAKALAEARVGAGGGTGEPGPADIAGRLQALAGELTHRAASQKAHRPGVAAALEDAARSIADAARDQLQPGMAEELLMAVESRLMEALRRGLPAEERAAVEADAQAAARASGATGEALERTRRAAVDRRIRNLLDLPRLELE